MCCNIFVKSTESYDVFRENIKSFMFIAFVSCNKVVTRCEKSLIKKEIRVKLPSYSPVAAMMRSRKTFNTGDVKGKY